MDVNTMIIKIGDAMGHIFDKIFSDVFKLKQQGKTMSKANAATRYAPMFTKIMASLKRDVAKLDSINSPEERYKIKLKLARLLQDKMKQAMITNSVTEDDLLSVMGDEMGERFVQMLKMPPDALVQIMMT